MILRIAPTSGQYGNIFPSRLSNTGELNFNIIMFSNWECIVLYFSVLYCTILLQYFILLNVTVFYCILLYFLMYCTATLGLDRDRDCWWAWEQVVLGKCYVGGSWRKLSARKMQCIVWGVETRLGALVMLGPFEWPFSPNLDNFKPYKNQVEPGYKGHPIEFMVNVF